MTQMMLTNRMQYNNILYIGDEAKVCLSVIEKFNNRLKEIERLYKSWFSSRKFNAKAPDKLQHHIQYHFEGGIAIFKFRNEDELPADIRIECLMACSKLAAEQSLYIS
jgi:hypothetical protein